MLIHCSRSHAGELISPSARSKFADNGRGMCDTENYDVLQKSDELCFSQVQTVLSDPAPA